MPRWENGNSSKTGHRHPHDEMWFYNGNGFIALMKPKETGTGFTYTLMWTVGPPSLRKVSGDLIADEVPFFSQEEISRLLSKLRKKEQRELESQLRKIEEQVKNLEKAGKKKDAERLRQEHFKSMMALVSLEIQSLSFHTRSDHFNPFFS
jgi:hypothetical protein